MSKAKSKSSSFVYVYSTLANDQKFNFFPAGVDNGSVPQPQQAVIINGSAGVANKKTLITVLGVVTKVSADDYDRLQTNKTFQGFVSRGFLVAMETPVDVEVAAADLNRDPASPLNEQDFENLDGAALQKKED